MSLDVTDLNAKNTLSGQKYKLDNLSFKTSKNATSTTSGSFTIVAILEGKGNDRGQIGMASIDLRYSELNLCQFVDTSSYTLLKIRLSLYEPIEIVLPESSGSDKSSNNEVLIDLLKNNYTNTQLCAIHRKFFNDLRGIELVKQLSISECSNIDTSVLSKYFCLAAAAALIKYVEHIQNIFFAQHSLKIIYEAIDDSCLIGFFCFATHVNSWQNIELIHFSKSSSTKNQHNSLFEILNNCLTIGGARTLRSCLLQPCVDPDIINIRLDVVEEFVNNQGILDKLRSTLLNLHDLQQLITLFVHVNLNLNMTKEESFRSIRNKIIKCIELKKLLVIVKSLSGILGQTKSSFLLKSRKRLDDARLNEISEIVDAKIDVSATTRKRKSSLLEKDAVLFAVTGGQHVLLDLARRAYEELRAHIFVLELQNIKDSKLENAELIFNHSRGYHYNLPSNNSINVVLPSYCIQIVRNRASVSFTTRDLIKYNDRLVQSENEILLKSNMVLDQLISAIRNQLPALYNCIELISLLDFFSSLAIYSIKTKTVRPYFGSQLIIKQGRHPILDIKNEIVPNDTYAIEEERFSIIAGPNMAGKSTYMQQICLLQILAQCGCRVPAEFACFVPMKTIFSRIGHNDNLVQGFSGFAVEVKIE